MSPLPVSNQPADSSSRAVPAGIWHVDSSHSKLQFSVRHLMVSKVRGHFGSFAGTVTTGSDPLDATVEGCLDVSSIDTGDVARDDHLRSKDFFDVNRWPHMRLAGRIVATTPQGYLLRADMTIRDATRTVALDVMLDPLRYDQDATPRLCAQATATVSRKDFGLQWNATIEAGGVLVADQVELLLTVEALLTRDSRAATD